MDGAQTDGYVNQTHNMEDVAELKVVTTNNKDKLQYNWDPTTGNVVVPPESLSRIDPL
jgi:hypothetical protein